MAMGDRPIHTPSPETGITGVAGCLHAFPDGYVQRRRALTLILGRGEVVRKLSTDCDFLTTSIRWSEVKFGRTGELHGAYGDQAFLPHIRFT
ncbi:hypothetical protein BDD14_2322 [Edaphobacter modestus]|uniref:Uncharacterized protein n=1 Tax=Edaphobacter modestus TaxID=388466 RepID=A0A4V2G4G1_9BACT|nr:hypothetical protein BDD14_2322 [Edaphobacter modestus]